jgi:hypothetical protein
MIASLWAAAIIVIVVVAALFVFVSSVFHAERQPNAEGGTP